MKKIGNRVVIIVCLFGLLFVGAGLFLGGNEASANEPVPVEEMQFRIYRYIRTVQFYKEPDGMIYFDFDFEAEPREGKTLYFARQFFDYGSAGAFNGQYKIEIQDDPTSRACCEDEEEQ